MLFTSPFFLTFFLPFVLVVNLLLNKSYRNTWLFMVSVFFYFWGEGFYTLLMLISICSNYLFGLAIEKGLRSSKQTGRYILLVSVAINILILLYFKYFNFFTQNLSDLGLFDAKNIANIHLPLGVSFFTFENISYCVDVYKQEVKSQKNIISYGLFVTLFPHLIAGPIVKYHTLAEQIDERTSTKENIHIGIIRFCFGLFKKLFIANNLAFIADQVFNGTFDNVSTSSAWIAIIAYSLQLYFDFSGYSDMALGLAKMFGFDLLENFRYPYTAISIQDFWRRWHISLSTWFKEYLYIPLGGNKGSSVATYKNLFLVFLFTGLWHGASWNFVIWGLLHGLFIIIERGGRLDFMKTGYFRPLGHVYTLSVVMFAWVFFRVEDFHEALRFIRILLGLEFGNNNLVIAYLDNFHLFVFFLAVIFSMPLFLNFQKLFQKIKQAQVLNKYEYSINIMDNLLLLILALGCLYLSILEMSTNTYNPFIYFRF